MTPQEFVARWSKIQQKETAVSQSHFNDVCQLVGHPIPIEYDPTGKRFSFETQTAKPDGRKGFADVFFKDHFIWEYKGPHKDLDKAYRQLQLYREDLQNPPLLITSDIHNIIIHTNFNNYPTQKHHIGFDEIMAGDGVEKLRWAFFDPDKFRPAQTQQEITQASADTFIAVADAMKKHQEVTGEEYSAEQLAHFMARLLFTLFAEDMELLPARVFTQVLESHNQEKGDMQGALRALFQQMRDGGFFIYTIRYFDGTLFDDDFVPTIPTDVVQALLVAADQDWSAVDPSIFGTLFERVIDEGKRAQLGAHYTSVDDIMLIVEPVLMAPLRKRWDDVRRQADRLLRKGEAAEASTALAAFSDEIAVVRVLDPACGSGNFLYVALRQLLNLQKAVIAYAERKGAPPIPLTVAPEQLYGIEINVYAHELAQITAWIGYLQWRKENGFDKMDDPVLRPLDNIKNMDAILACDADGNPIEPEWPPADVIIGNPPFLGGNRIRGELGDETVDNIFKLYDGRVPAFADLVCYWFEKARVQIEQNGTKRAGLIATNSIRGGVNREVLKRIKESGDIFMAWSDNAWVLDGAAVRVSIVGFDDDVQQEKSLDGKHALVINSDLTDLADLTQAKQLLENDALVFGGTKKGGSFDISERFAMDLIKSINTKPDRQNKDVVKPWVSGSALLGIHVKHTWIIDFGVDMPMEEAMLYEAPFKYVKENIYPIRSKNRMERRKKYWWLHSVTGSKLREAIKDLPRYIATPRVSKFRLYVWLSPETLPDDGTYAFARSDDYFFGVLHSRLHELWALRLGTWLGKGNDPRYTPTTTFETFPFPWLPGKEPAAADDERIAEIEEWAQALVEWRQAWLHPRRNGMNGGNGGIDTAYEKMLKRRTLTNLYNGLVYYRQARPDRFAKPVRSGLAGLFDQAAFDKTTRKAVTIAEIEELDDIHIGLDNAVLDAYGWPHTLTDEQILEHLLALNLERAAA